MSDVPSPKASRQSRPKWLDPKLFLGLLLVLGSMALGARIIGQADQTDTVLVAAEDIAKNAPVTADSFAEIDIRFTDDSVQRYVGPGSDFTGARSTRVIKAGELVPRSAITNKKAPNLKDIPLPIANTRLPADAGAGDRVDVWLQARDADTPQKKEDPPAPVPGLLALENVLLLNAPDGESVGAGAAVTIRVNMDKFPNFDAAVFLGRLSQMQVVLVERAAPGDKATDE